MAVLPSSSTMTDQSLRPRNTIVLLAAIQTFLLTGPNLLMSLSGVLDKDVLLPFLIGDDEFQKVLQPGVTRILYELSLNAIMFYSIAYYRVYIDGVQEHPLIIAVGGLGKISASLLLLKAYIQGNTTIQLLLAATIPDWLFGLYFVYLWSKLNFTFKAVVAVSNNTKKD